MADRRTFLKTIAAGAGALALPACMKSLADSGKPVNILLVSGWQDVNIGDIAHTPGLLEVLEKNIPNAKITLVKLRAGAQAEAMISKHFPKVKILHSQIKDEKFTDPQLQADIEAGAYDTFLHGSGPSVVGRRYLIAWAKATKKPFGVFGTTVQTPTDEVVGILKKASFVFTRETESIRHLADAGVTGPEIKFVPDATFGMTIRDEESALNFMKERGLKEREFICVVPRLRVTPYWQIRKESAASYSEAKKKEITDLNNKWKEPDHAKAREAIIRWVRETKKKVVICPEMTYQVEIMDELLINPLPDDVKPYVQKRGYWLPDEAASLYSRAFCILSFECHSPIIAMANGTPAFYLRQPQDTIKGQMYYDLGFKDWTFEIEESTGKQIADRLMEVYKDFGAAQKYRKAGIDKADSLFAYGAKRVYEVALEGAKIK